MSVDTVEVPRKLLEALLEHTHDLMEERHWWGQETRGDRRESYLRYEEDAKQVARALDQSGPRTVDGKLSELLTGYSLELTEGNYGEILITVNCNDVFWPAADAEIVYYDDIHKLYGHVKHHPKWGHIMWVCQKRGELPTKDMVKTMLEDGVPEEFIDDVRKVEQATVAAAEEKFSSPKN